MFRFLPLLLVHALVWLAFLSEAFMHGRVNDYIKWQRDNLKQESNARLSSGQDGENEPGGHRRKFVETSLFRPALIVQLLAFQTTNVMGVFYVTYVTRKLRYARSHAPIHVP